MRKMTYYPDLSLYECRHRHEGQSVKNCFNVGWLDARPFVREEPTSGTLGALWLHCQVQVARTRGVHDCELCNDERAVSLRRDGTDWLLGIAEIRVFGEGGRIYAAPNLIFHYVERHHYRPPDEFLVALVGECVPPSEEYFRRVAALDPDWRKAAPTPYCVHTYNAGPT